MNPEEHKKWPYDNWKASFKRLKEAIARDKGRMLVDKANYEHDLAIVKSQRQGPEPWHRSECPNLLKQDIDDGKHLTMTPKQMYEQPDRPQYRATVTLDQFRKHIHQEKDSRPKREHRFAKKKKAWKFPELHKDHPRLKAMAEEASSDDD